MGMETSWITKEEGARSRTVGSSPKGVVSSFPSFTHSQSFMGEEERKMNCSREDVNLPVSEFPQNRDSDWKL